VRHKKEMFDYECADESSRLLAEETFKLLFFLVLTGDQAIYPPICHDLTNSWSGISCLNFYGAISLEQCDRGNEIDNHSKNYTLNKKGGIETNVPIMELNHTIYVIKKETRLFIVNKFLT